MTRTAQLGHCGSAITISFNRLAEVTYERLCRSARVGVADFHRNTYSLTRIFAYVDILTMNPDTLAALGEPNRFRIVELLRTGPRSVNDIRVRLGLRQSQVSQHLTVLKAVGLVEAEPRAQQRLYRLRAQPVKQLHKWLDRYRCIWEARFEQLDEVIEEIKRKEKSNAAGKR